MSTDKMSFRKRILLVKKETFEGIKNSNDLGTIAGTKKSGYYSLSTIYTYLYPALEKHDIDLDLILSKNHETITGIWYDCLSDEVRENIVDFSELSIKLKDIEKLPLMANVVQNDGAIKSYIRRYALTNILGLNATDEIENIPNNHSNNNFNNTVDNSKNSAPGGKNYTTTETNYKVSEKQLNRMFAIFSKTLLTDEDFKEDIKVKYNYKSRKDFKKNQYDEYCTYLESLITKNDEISFRKLMSNKGKTDEDLEQVLNAGGITELKRCNKSDLKILRDKLKKCPDVEGLPI